MVLSAKSKQILRITKYSYVLVVTVLVLMFGAQVLLDYYSTRSRDEDYKIINISGRQRMLTQRLNAVILATPEIAGPQFTRNSEIEQITGELSRGLQSLQQSRFLADDLKIGELYRKDDGVEDLTLRIIALAREIGNTNENRRAEFFRLAHLTLLPLLDEVTLLKQRKSESDFLRHKKMSSLSVGIAILALLVEIFFIFRPILRRLSSTLFELEELHKRNLVQARMAAIGETTASVGHELANSLAIMKMSADLLKQDHELTQPPPEKVKNLLAQVSSQVERMSFILKNIRKMGRNTKWDKPNEFDIGKELLSCREMLDQRLKLHEISCDIDVQSNEPIYAFGKATELCQVVTNLIGNAIDAVSFEKTERWIRVGLSANDTNVLIRITDSGAGVSPELRQKIFEPFFSTKGPEKGTGLGLSICKTIIESMDGTLQLNPKISPSCFEMTIPRLIAVSPRQIEIS